MCKMILLKVVTANFTVSPNDLQRGYSDRSLVELFSFSLLCSSFVAACASHMTKVKSISLKLYF